MCTLLRRTVLTAADEASGTLEVQALRFALPAGALAHGPTAHVKVRAPDAPGQRHRVRAYSMRLDEGAMRLDEGAMRLDGLARRDESGVMKVAIDASSVTEAEVGAGHTDHSHAPAHTDHSPAPAHNESHAKSVTIKSFTLIVKIYPGGPPATRGTSAFLGSMAVGSAVHVPQTRTMSWAVAPSHARRVGVVAFGVGLAECLEPLEVLLAAGAEVRLIHASRLARQILLRRELCALLEAYPSTLAVRHCLSRHEHTSADGAHGECRGREHVTRRSGGRGSAGGGVHRQLGCASSSGGPLSGSWARGRWSTRHGACWRSLASTRRLSTCCTAAVGGGLWCPLDIGRSPSLYATRHASSD